MRADHSAQFALRDYVVMFNHASYGLATIALLDAADRERRFIESDPNLNLGEALQARLHTVLLDTCSRFGLDLTASALTPNATAGAAAVMRSLSLRPGDDVVTLSCEYSSIQRGWQQRCIESGASYHSVRVPLPLDDPETLIELLDAVPVKNLAVLQISLVSSSAALLLPVQQLAAWAHQHGGLLVLDAAHGPGHLPDNSWNGTDGSGADIVFGTLHKWLPVPRAIGILWATSELAATIKPAEISLTWDAATLAGRFGWPGTYDPAPRLVMPDAHAAWDSWAEAGLLAHAETLADDATTALTSIGAEPTTSESWRPPRLRAFILRGVPVGALRPRLLDAGIRAWTGAHSENDSLLRIATHIYSDHDDIDRLSAEIVALLHSATERRRTGSETA